MYSKLKFLHNFLSRIDVDKGLLFFTMQKKLIGLTNQKYILEKCFCSFSKDLQSACILVLNFFFVVFWFFFSFFVFFAFLPFIWNENSFLWAKQSFSFSIRPIHKTLKRYVVNCLAFLELSTESVHCPLTRISDRPLSRHCIFILHVQLYT